MQHESGTLIRRPDGAYIDLNDVPDDKRLAHELVTKACQKAEDLSTQLAQAKADFISEMQSYRQMMMDDYNVKVGGKEGNLTLSSVCGTQVMELSVSKHITFGPELEAAKALIDEFLNAEMEKGASQNLRTIVSKVFRINSKGRLDTAGILGLREHRFDEPVWEQAMRAIDAAICKDSSTTYLRFYRVDVSKTPKERSIIPLDIAKV